MVGQRSTHGMEHLFVFDEQAFGLPCAVALVLVHAHFPQVFVAVVAHTDEAVFIGCLCAPLQIQPHGNLAPVERLLLDDAHGHLRFGAHERLLVGAVREEVALHDVVGTCVLCHGQYALFGGIHACQLRCEQVVLRSHMQHDVPFGHTAGRDEGRLLHFYAQIFQIYVLKCHLLFICGCKDSHF